MAKHFQGGLNGWLSRKTSRCVLQTIIHVYIQEHLCMAKHFPGRFEWVVIKENIKVCITNNNTCIYTGTSVCGQTFPGEV